MKRLIFLISLLVTSQVSANTKTVVITDTVYFNFTYTTAIDSAQLILIRGTVSDTISLMPITGSSHKICDWGPAIFNLVDSAGTYNVWIEPYSSGAIIDTILGDCHVELASREAQVTYLFNNVITDYATATSAVTQFWERDTATVNTGIGAMLKNMSASLIVAKGDVDSTVAGNKWLISHALTQGNDYWNENMILFFTGTAAGQVARIVAFVAVNDSVTFLPTLTVAPAVGDSFMILGILSETTLDVNVASADVDAFDNTDFAEAYWAKLTDRVWDEDTIGHKTDPQMGYWITQGGTASISDADKGDIADSIFLRIIANDTTSGGIDTIFADYVASTALSVGKDGVSNAYVTLQMKAGAYTGATGSNIRDDFDTVLVKIAAIDVGAGSGANTCSVWVYDTGNTVMVSDIKVRANNASGANQGMDRTNVTGIAVLNLDDGDYNLVIPMNSGYIQTTNPQPFTVSGATNDTIDVTWFSPSDPGGDLCAVYNYVLDGNRNGVPGVTITATIPTNFWPITQAGQAIRATATAKTDGNGLWQMSIPPSGLLLTADGDSASFWQFTAPGQLFGHMGYKVTVPDSASFFMVPDDE